ncbi:hypothetical protein TNCV_3449541 [Trichonephila clavipes]|nr:hypothetical protein TNCV_3449541 [Trichonephila clavipes]
MGKGKCHTGLNLVNREDVEAFFSASFGEELSYQLGSMCWYVVMQKISVITLPELSTLTTNRFPSNDVFEKCVASVVCPSVWRLSLRIHSDTNATFFMFREVEGGPTRSLHSMDYQPSLALYLPPVLISTTHFKMT